jgi:dienelactone hydrolase
MFWYEDQPQYSVLLKRGEFVDPARGGRVVPFKMYYPAPEEVKTDTSVPVIFWSHGFGGNRDGAAFLSRYLAARGYALVHLTHEGTDSSIWEGKPGHPWDILKAHHVPRDVTMNRFHDVPFAVDALKNWAQDNGDLTAMWDFENLGISGHSFGAMTTQVIAGQLVPDKTGKLLSLKDDRFRAGIVYSPVPISHLSDAPNTQLYGPIDIPLLHMTGTRDASPLENFDYDHRLLVYDHTDHPEKYLLVKQDGDHMIYNGTRGKLDKTPHRARHEEIIQVMAHAFWDAQLKDDAAAQEWLKSNTECFLRGYAVFKREG